MFRRDCTNFRQRFIELLDFRSRGSNGYIPDIFEIAQVASRKRGEQYTYVNPAWIGKSIEHAERMGIGKTVIHNESDKKGFQLSDNSRSILTEFYNRKHNAEWRRHQRGLFFSKLFELKTYDDGGLKTLLSIVAILISLVALITSIWLK